MQRKHHHPITIIFSSGNPQSIVTSTHHHSIPQLYSPAPPSVQVTLSRSSFESVAISFEPGAA